MKTPQMIDPSTLAEKDLDAEALPRLIDGYVGNGAGMDDWMALITAVRDLSYHVGYAHGYADNPGASSVWTKNDLDKPPIGDNECSVDVLAYLTDGAYAVMHYDFCNEIWMESKLLSISEEVTYWMPHPPTPSPV